MKTLFFYIKRSFKNKQTNRLADDGQAAAKREFSGLFKSVPKIFVYKFVFCGKLRREFIK